MSGGEGARDEALGRLAEELARVLAAGEPGDSAELARRFGVTEADVERCRRAIAATLTALDEDLPRDLAEPVPLPELPDDFELGTELGRGGMGVVYRAYQRSLDRAVAVKVLRPGELLFRGALERFRREAKSLGRLRHEHIVAIHEIGEAGGNLFFSMDLIVGGSLATLIEEGEVTPARAVRLLRQVASAIAYTHSHGVIHRDLKPGNILVDEADNAFVADFGLARDVVPSGDTTTGHVLGTPDFMSPEQARGDGARVGEASDIYALGAVLYACLTGRAPFKGLALADKIHAVVYDEPPSPSKLNPRVPRDLEVICKKAMSKSPSDRFATARALHEDLERFDEGRPILARRPSLWRRAVRRVSARRRELVAALAMLVVLLPFFWIARSGEQPSRRSDADALFAAGEHRAALLLYEQESDPALAGEVSEDELVRLDWGRARCHIELANVARLSGDAGDVTREAERASTILTELAVRVTGRGPALSVKGGEIRSGWIELRMRIRSDLAIARALAGDLDGAAEVFDELGEYGDFFRWVDRALEPFGARVADPEDAGHVAGVLFMAHKLDWETYGSVGRWLFERGDLAVPALVGFLRTLVTLPSPLQTAARRGLLEHGALHDPRLRSARLVELGDALAAVARDETASEDVRALALVTLAYSADLPVRPSSDYVDASFERDELPVILAAWEAERKGPALSGRIRRALGSLGSERGDALPPECAASTSRWLATVLGIDDERARNPSYWERGESRSLHPGSNDSVFAALKVTPPAIEQALERFTSANGGERRLLHLLLSQMAPEGFRRPFWPVWGSGAEPPGLDLAWRAVLSFDRGAPRFRVRVAHFAFVGGAREPQRLFEHQELVGPGDRFDIAIGTEPVDYVTKNRVGLDSLRLIPERMRRARPGRYFFAWRGELVERAGGWALDYRHCEDDLSIGGDPESTLVRTADAPLVAGRVQPLILREYQWPREGLNSSLQLTLAVLEPQPSDDAPWTIEDWRARLEREIVEDVRRAVRAYEGYGPELRRSRWILGLEEPQRASMVNQWLLGAYLGVPGARDALRTMRSLLGETLEWGELYGEPVEDDSRWRASDPKKRFRRSGVYLLAGRLGAGDALALDEEEGLRAMREWHFGRAVWTRLFHAVGSREVREVALAEIAAEGAPLVALRAIAGVATNESLELPAGALERAKAAPAILRVESLRRSIFPLSVVGLLLVLNLFCAGYLLTRRGRGSARVGVAAWSIWLAAVSTDKSVELLGVVLPLESVAYFTGAIGALHLARFTSRRSMLPATLLGAACVIDVASRALGKETIGLAVARFAFACGIAALPLVMSGLAGAGQKRLYSRPFLAICAVFLLLPIAGAQTVSAVWRALQGAPPLDLGSWLAARNLVANARDAQATLAGLAYFALWLIVAVALLVGLARSQYEKEQERLAA